MYDLSDFDALNKPSLAYNEKIRKIRSRVQIACKTCRQRKQKCDGALRCKACHKSDKMCVYEKIAPKTLVAQRKELSTYHEGLLITGPLHFESLEISPVNQTELFSSQKLRELSDSYMENVHVLHPIFDDPRTMCDCFIKEYSDTAAVREYSIVPSLRNANILLFLALGSCKSTKEGLKHSCNMPGMEYYSRAQDILAHRRKEYSIALAQAMTLAALYTNQIARLRESWADISLAYHIYMNYGNCAGVRNDVSAAQDQSTPMSQETRRSYCICRELTRGIDACLNIVSVGLVPISGSDIFPGPSPEKGPETVYGTRVLFRILLEEVRRLTPTDLAATGRIDEADLEYLTSRSNKQIGILETWRSGLPSRLAWEDEEPPSTDPLMASLRSEYYNGMAQLLRPYLEITQNCECFNVTVDKQSAGQRGFIEVILSWINGTLLSIIAFDRIGAVSDSAYEAYRRASRSSVMLSNPVKTLHLECENVLILQAIRSSAIYPLLAGRTQLTEASLTALRLRTVDRLSGFWPNSPLLTQDLRMLRML